MILAKIFLFKGERKRCDVTDLFYHRVVCWGKVQREGGGGEWVLLAAVFARVSCQCVFHAL